MTIFFAHAISFSCQNDNKLPNMNPELNLILCFDRFYIPYNDQMLQEGSMTVFTTESYLCLRAKGIHNAKPFFFLIPGLTWVTSVCLT